MNQDTINRPSAARRGPSPRTGTPAWVRVAAGLVPLLVVGRSAAEEPQSPGAPCDDAVSAVRSQVTDPSLADSLRAEGSSPLRCAGCPPQTATTCQLSMLAVGAPHRTPVSLALDDSGAQLAVVGLPTCAREGVCSPVLSLADLEQQLRPSERRRRTEATFHLPSDVGELVWTVEFEPRRCSKKPRSSRTYRATDGELLSEHLGQQSHAP